MKTKFLAGLLLASSSLFAGPRISIGIGVGGYGGGYYPAPLPPPVVAYAPPVIAYEPPCPGPGGSSGSPAPPLASSSGWCDQPIPWYRVRAVRYGGMGGRGKTSNKTFNVTLSNPTNGASLGTPTTAVITLTEKDGTPTQLFIAHAYLDILGRPVDSGGLATWTAFLGISCFS